MNETPHLETEFTDNKSDESTAVVLDLRNSTKVMRKIADDHSELKKYTDFVMGIHGAINSVLQKNKLTTCAVNDTGDGFVMLLWKKYHAYIAYNIALSAKKYLDHTLSTLNNDILNLEESLHLDYGIGMHSGGSLVYRVPKLQKNFMFGTVINSAARLQAFTKIFTKSKILCTNYFISRLKSDYVLSGLEKNEAWEKWSNEHLEKLTTEPVDINDAKGDGHVLYTVK